MAEVSPGSLLSGTLASYGASAVARVSDRGRVAEVITNIPKRFGALNQGFPFSPLQCRQGRTRMDEGAAMCTMHAVVVLCFGCWQGLANRSMRIQDLYVGPFPIPRFIKE